MLKLLKQNSDLVIAFFVGTIIIIGGVMYYSHIQEEKAKALEQEKEEMNALEEEHSFDHVNINENTAYEDYLKLEPGMTLAEVEETLGGKGELYGSSQELDTLYETYYWDYAESTNVGGDFENKVLVLPGGWDEEHGYFQEPGEY